LQSLILYIVNIGHFFGFFWKIRRKSITTCISNCDASGILPGLVEGNMAVDWMRDLRVESDRLDREKYEAYLRSPAWRALVDKLRGFHGGLNGEAKCWKCMRTEAEVGRRHDGHHSTYNYFGGYARGGYEAKEEMSTVRLLCRECHDLEHRKWPRKKWRG
jgi:hypothetical protein